MKNLNSFKAIARAIEGERQRQIELLEEGKPVTQETRRWDDNKEYSYAMRSKEDAQDYRYFPDPDLAPVHISEAWLQQIREKQPEFRDEKMARYKEEFNIPDYDIEILTSSKHLADLFEATSALCGQPKKVSNWLMVETLRLLKEKDMEPEEIRFSPENLASLIGLTERKVINGSVAKEVFEVLFEKDIDPEKYVEEKGLKTERDEGALKKSIEEIVEANPQSVDFTPLFLGNERGLYNESNEELLFDNIDITVAFFGVREGAACKRAVCKGEDILYKASADRSVRN